MVGGTASLVPQLPDRDIVASRGVRGAHEALEYVDVLRCTTGPAPIQQWRRWHRGRRTSKRALDDRGEVLGIAGRKERSSACTGCQVRVRFDATASERHAHHERFGNRESEGFE